MLRLQMRRGDMSIDALPSFETLLSRLREQWPPLIRPVQELQSARFGLSHEDLHWGIRGGRSLYSVERDDLLNGEIYVVPDGLLVLTLRRLESGGRIRLRESEGQIVGSSDENDRLVVDVSALTHSDASQVLQEVGQAAIEILGIPLEKRVYKNDRFNRFREEVVAEELPREDSDVAAALALLPRNARTLAVAVKSSRGLLARDSKRQVSDTVDPLPLLQGLVDAGLITREVVVICNSSGAQVARVPEESSLVKLAKAGLRCACGQPIDQEQPERLYTITDIGVLLLDKSRWMSILVRNTLMECGVPAQDILLECQLGSDEIDCIALVSGEIVIFELKDKDFNIGNAYSFGAKMSILKAEHSVIVTTETVSADVKDHFSRTAASSDLFRHTLSQVEQRPINYIEGPGFLSDLPSVIGEIYAGDGQRILDDALSLGVARSESLVEALQARDLDLN